MKRFPNSFRLLATSALVAGLSACGDGSDTLAGTGTLRLALTDAPACGYDAVKVTVQSVRVHQSPTAEDGDAGWETIALAEAQQVDLLSLTNGVLLELGQASLPAGRYRQLRLVLADNDSGNAPANAVTPTGDTERALSTPSAQQSGLKLRVSMDIAAEQVADYVIDFDACRSVVRAGNSGQYLLKPVLSVLPRSTTGVSGEVATALVGPDTTVALQSNGVTVRATLPTSTGSFLLQPVPAGNYTFVLQSPGRATTVVDNVTVGANQVARLHPQGEPLDPPPSPTGTLSGTVLATSLADTVVRVLQPLTGGPTVELFSRPVDGVTGQYLYSVNTAAPRRAPYAAGGSLLFAADTAAEGRFSVEAQFDGVTELAGPFPLADEGGLVIDFPQP
jgi:hypothetical protein